jgi:hypothetical protein
VKPADKSSASRFVSTAVDTLFGSGVMVYDKEGKRMHLLDVLNEFHERLEAVEMWQADEDLTREENRDR